MLKLTPIALNLWGKYNASSSEFHPAAYHMLDVALAALAIFETLSKNEQDRLLRPFVKSKSPLKALLLLIALHDIGKLTPGFQLKRPEWRKRLEELAFFWRSIAEKNENAIHGCTGYVLLTEILEKELTIPTEVSKALANTVAGHHGTFFHGAPKLRPGERLWHEARKEVVGWLQMQLGISWNDILVDSDEVTPAYVAYLAGFCSVSDWLGSDEGTFRYLNTGDYDRKEREQNAREQTKSLSLKQAGLLPGKSKFEDIFSYIPNATPNTTQQVSLNLFDRTNSPTLTIIETPMGSGKTEAALALADKYVREQGKTGFYFALPTQATGNQLFERAVEFLKRHPAKVLDLEMHLRHSNASLNAQYESLQSSSVDNDQREGVVASRWFTSNKRGLLSAYAVGTVDQCLIASLQVRHFFVRLFGLSNKVVIIDEVHAYTTYTSRILEGLLGWLAVLGAPVILLSATLPASRRKALLRAFHPAGIALSGNEERYPRITCLGASGQYFEAAVRDGNSKLPLSFEIRLVETPLAQRWEKSKLILSEVLENGGCAACIVNTVKDAQKLFKILRVHFADDNDITLILFHARFPLYRRLEIENSIKSLFGKGDSDSPNPLRAKKAIVVGTQVLEQSLDVDFDVMISMLAPIDLLLQRVGRVHRHCKNQPIRPAKLASPIFYCLHPPIENGNENADTVFGNSEAYIYEPYSLLYTMLSLNKRAKKEADFSTLEINMPNDMETLIDEVYEGKLGLENEKQQLRGELWEFEARQKDRIEVKFADDVKLPAPNERLRTFFRNLEKSEDDEKVALTRLALPSIGLVILQKEKTGHWCLAEELFPVDLNVTPDKAILHKLIRSSVRISHPGWVEYFSLHINKPTSWQSVALLSDCYPLYLAEGSFRCDEVKGALIWKSELGLVLE